MGKHHFVRIGSVLVLFALAIRCDASFWDFEEKAQKNDWKMISGTGEIDKDAYKISHGAEGLAIAGESNWTNYTTCKTDKFRETLMLTYTKHLYHVAIIFLINPGLSRKVTWEILRRKHVHFLKLSWQLTNRNGKLISVNRY